MVHPDCAMTGFSTIADLLQILHLNGQVVFAHWLFQTIGSPHLWTGGFISMGHFSQEMSKSHGGLQNHSNIYTHTPHTLRIRYTPHTIQQRSHTHCILHQSTYNTHKHTHDTDIPYMLHNVYILRIKHNISTHHKNAYTIYTLTTQHTSTTIQCNTDMQCNTTHTQDTHTTQTHTAQYTCNTHTHPCIHITHTLIHIVTEIYQHITRSSGNIKDNIGLHCDQTRKFMLLVFSSYEQELKFKRWFSEETKKQKRTVLCIRSHFFAWKPA